MEAIKLTDVSHEDWLKLRQHGIGGSDAAAVMGLNPWKSPLDVYLDKVSEEPIKIEETPKMRAGKELEEVVARWWMEETGMKVRRDNKIRIHPAHIFLIANIDRTIVADDTGRGPGILEIKTTSSHMMRKWEDEGWPYIPVWHCQIQHYLSVTGYDWGEIAVLVDGYDFRRIQVERDQEFIDTLVDAEVSFWEKHVAVQNPPEPKNEKDVLKLFPKSEPGSTLEASQELFQMILDLNDIKKQIDLLTQKKKDFEEAIKTVMKDNEAITYEGDTLVTWKTTITNRLDSKALKKDYPDLYSKYAKEYVSRRFLLKLK